MLFFSLKFNSNQTLAQLIQIIFISYLKVSKTPINDKYNVVIKRKKLSKIILFSK